MDSEYSLQDVVRCHLCEHSVPHLHCVICKIHLCKDCESGHLSDTTKEHKMVPFKYRRSIPKCQNHSTKICELYCKQCNTPICAYCVSSEEHQGHAVEKVLTIIEKKKTRLTERFKRFRKNHLSKISRDYT